MKRFSASFLSLALLFSLSACGGSGHVQAPAATPTPTEPPVPAETTPPPENTPQSDPVELVVFAAASLTESMGRIAELYQAVAPHVRITYTFDSSGTLKTQIESGADCDLFLSAAQKQMNQLDASCDAAEGNPDALDFVLQGTRINLLENQVVLTVPEGNPANVTSFDAIDTDQVTLLALGNSDVPVGQYAQEILTNMGIWDGIQNKVTFGSNVKEVTAWVSEGAVDCGVVYSTDAAAAGLEVVAFAPSGMLQSRVLYPAAVINTTRYQDEAQAFLDFLQSPEATTVFEDAGFSIAQ